MTEPDEPQGSTTETKIARSASIASWLGKFGPSCALAGLLGIHIGVVPPMGGYIFFLIGLLAALLAVITGAVGFFQTWKDDDDRGRFASGLGLIMGMVMISLSLVGAGDGGGSPAINDITTDLDDPPEFASSNDVADYAGRDMSYPADFAPVVREHYPDLSPIALRTDEHSAYEKSIEAAEKLGWQIVHRDPDALTFDAQAMTKLFKFVDDITIRVRSRGDESIVDIRSKSRVGKGDVGANAMRIRSFRDEITQV